MKVYNGNKARLYSENAENISEIVDTTGKIIAIIDPGDVVLERTKNKAMATHHVSKYESGNKQIRDVNLFRYNHVPSDTEKLYIAHELSLPDPMEVTHHIYSLNDEHGNTVATLGFTGTLANYAKITELIERLCCPSPAPAEER